MSVLSDIVVNLFAHPVQGPKIVDLAPPVKIMGMGVDTTISKVARDVARLGKQYERYKKNTEIPDLKTPWGFAAVSTGYDPQAQTFHYFMGDVVTRFEYSSPGLKPFEIPAGTYAVFAVRPKNKLGWPVAIAATKRLAYQDWLPGSAYEPAGGAVDDFEYHDERSVSKNPEIDLYVAIKPKNDPDLL